MSDGAQTSLADVEVVREGGMALLCRIAGRECWVPKAQLLSGTTVRKAGDRGSLVIPSWLAIDLGVAARNQP